MTYAALFRGRSSEVGPAADALDQANWVLQLLASGDPDMALMIATDESSSRRSEADGGLRSKLAFAIALDAEWQVHQAVADLEDAVAIGAELVALCESIADAPPDSWDQRDGRVRQLVVGQLPRRLVEMVRLYAMAERHEDALDATARAASRCGGPDSSHPVLADLFAALAAAVFAEMRRRGQAAAAG
jgi:hypothetical protein